MNPVKLFSIGCRLALARISNRKKPLFLSWQITQRCNLRCKYCDYWNGRKEDELSTKEIGGIIDELAALGTVAISFTGGEPLIRNDIGELVSYAKSKGISCKINTNGILIPMKLEQIKDIDQVNLSFDGPQEIHDQVRGAGAYEAMLNAVKLLKRYNKNIFFHTTLTKYNLSAIDLILDKCHELEVGTFFQPATELYLLKRNINPHSPEINGYQEAIKLLIREKKKGDKYICNSLSGLRHLLHWPKPKQIYCSAGRVMFRIDAKGQLYNCDRFSEANRLSCRDKGLSFVLQNLKPSSCKECWCGPLVELNLAMSFRFDAIMNAFKL
jgi:MoaA/NifB/PqqE/SkfB family radical SAM enzyme